MTVEEHLQILANVVMRLNTIQEELKAIETRIAAQRTLVAQDIDSVERQREFLKSQKT